MTEVVENAMTHVYTIMSNVFQSNLFLYFMLPFLLIFAIVYAVLGIVGPFAYDSTDNNSNKDDEKKKEKRFARFLIAFVLAFYVAIFTNFGEWLAPFFAKVSVLFIMVLVVIILMAMFGVNIKNAITNNIGNKKYLGFALIVLLFLTVWFVAGTVCINEFDNGFVNIKACGSGETPLISQWGIPTLQAFVTGSSTIEGSANGGINLNDEATQEIIIIILVFVIFFGMLYLLYHWFIGTLSSGGGGSGTTSSGGSSSNTTTQQGQQRHP